MLRLRDCVEIVSVGLMPDQITVDLQQFQILVKGRARDSGGVFGCLRGKLQGKAIGIRRKIHVQLQTIRAKLFVDRHPVRILNLQEIAMHHWLMNLNRLLICIS